MFCAPSKNSQHCFDNNTNILEHQTTYCLKNLKIHFEILAGQLSFVRYYQELKNPWADCRAVASLTVPGGQELHFPHFFLKFQSIFLNFPQTSLVVFLILALRVGESPTREGPGYATGRLKFKWHFENFEAICFII